jgi:hypothetical protein
MGGEIPPTKKKMSKFLRVLDGDYNIKVQSGGEITLDTGAQVGTVRITGNLVVEGDNTTVESENMVVKDNTITVNSGEGGTGVTLGTAGLIIDRGTVVDAQFLFDDNLTYYDPATAGAGDGVFKLTYANGDPIGLRTNSISSGGAIYLQPGGAGAVTAYKVNYETFVVQDNDIPNKKYVDDEIALAISTLAPTFIERGDTEVRVYDTALGDPTSKATVEIDGVLKNTFLANQVDFLQEQINLAEIRIQDSTVSAPGTGGDLILQATGAQSVRIDDTLLIKTAAISPSYDGIGLKLYTGAQGSGKTGLFYVNSTNTRDEIISKNRSLLFSMIF